MSFNKKKISLILLAIISLCFFVFRVTGNQKLDNLFKSLFLIFTAIYYISSIKKVDFNYIISLCLFLIGDVIFFGKNTSNDFIFLGLASYFLAMFFISLVVSSKIYINFTSKKSTVYIIPLLILLFMTYFLFRDNYLNIVLVLFTLSFAFLFSLALYYYLARKNSISILLLFGSSLLVICNLFAAINRFETPNKYYTYISGFSYLLALFLITNFLIKSEDIVITKDSS